MDVSLVIASSENWQRINLASELCIREALLDILHNRNNDPSYDGLPEDEASLFPRMQVFRPTHERRLRSIIRPNEWAIICPITGRSNSNDWEFRIIRLVIQYENLIPPPLGGWKMGDSLLDNTKAANVCRAIDIHNKLRHAL